MKHTSLFVALIAAAGLVACVRARAPVIDQPARSASATSATPSPHDSLGIVTIVEQTAAALGFTVLVRNESPRVRHLEWGDCSMNFRFFSGADRAGMAAYDWSRRPEPANSTRICLTYLRVADLGPGEQIAPKEFHVVVPLAWIVGDSLKAGRYYSDFTLRLVNPSARSEPVIIRLMGPEVVFRNTK